MASAKGPVKKGQPSIKHSCNFAEAKRKVSKVSDREHVEYAYAWQRHNSRRGETMLSQILSRDALISVVDLMWDRSDFVSNTLISSVKEENLDDLKRDEVSKFKVSEDSTRWSADQKAKSQLLPTPQPSVQLVRVAEKMCIFDPYKQNYNQSFFSLFNQTSGAKSINGFPLEARWETEKLYSWMEEVAPIITRYHKGAEIEKKEKFEDRLPQPVSSKSVSASGNANRSDSVFVTTGSEGHSTSIESRSPLLGSITESSGDTRLSRSTDANYLFLLYKDRCANDNGVNIINPKCSTDCDTEISSSSGDNSDANPGHEEVVKCICNNDSIADYTREIGEKGGFGM